ncbi:terminase small subunit [Clostridium sp. HBUAS56010]|uniref:terminase small subunit n=1 Tax=Clostridium sp. HBUAS56010 TaxID=2571127 RepID=UPI0011774BCF|nr:terminase small subunit [Clostridium sp. HBUAS56010]
MARVRSPNRDKAFDIYKQHGGEITNREIAAMLNEDEKVIAVWKSRDKWNVVQQSKERCTTKKAQHDKIEKKAVAKEVESVMSNEDLTDKQRLFCVYYSKSFNATQSYKKAYDVSYDVANAEGYKLLVNPCVRTEIMKLKEDRYAKAFLSEEDIFQKYMDIAYSDITDYLTFGKKDIEYTDKAGNERTATVSYVDLNESSEVDGSLISEVSQGKDGVKVKLADRMKALQWLSDHKGMATPEQLAKIAQIEAQTNKLTADEKEQSERVVIVNDIPRPESS